MLSNYDIERKKNAKKDDYKIFIYYAANMTNHDKKILNSKRFKNYLNKVLHAYSKGSTRVRLPLFYSKHFPYLVINKLKSFSLESGFVYDYCSHAILISPTRSSLSSAK